MATISGPSPKLRRDYIYMAIFGIQLFAILLVDLVPLYPEYYYTSKSSPVYYFLQLRSFYTELTNDPFFVTPHAQQPRWFQLFTLIEAAYQLPMVIWMCRTFEYSLEGTTPRFELACVAYGVQVALTTLVCVYDVAFWDPVVYDTQAKTMFIFGIYGPWVVIPLVMAYDMGHRLLARIDEGEKLKAAADDKKSQ